MEPRSCQLREILCRLTLLFLLTLFRRFNQQVLIDTTPLPESIPPVKEIGATSAPLLSAAFFIGARCRDYNDDYMQCKTEANGRGELECMKEGRRVTRCAASVFVTPHPISTNLPICLLNPGVSRTRLVRKWAPLFATAITNHRCSLI